MAPSHEKITSGLYLTDSQGEVSLLHKSCDVHEDSGKQPIASDQSTPPITIGVTIALVTVLMTASGP